MGGAGLIVLDTHALIWWVNGDAQLTSNAKNAIEEELAKDGGSVLLSAISAWEVAMLVKADRLVLTMAMDEWLEAVSAIAGVRFVPLGIDVAVESTRLPGEFHKDPADRMIVALARQLNVPLVTADMKIRAYRHVRSIW